MQGARCKIPRKLPPHRSGPLLPHRAGVDGRRHGRTAPEVLVAPDPSCSLASGLSSLPFTLPLSYLSGLRPSLPCVDGCARERRHPRPGLRRARRRLRVSTRYPALPFRPPPSPKPSSPNPNACCFHSDLTQLQDPPLILLSGRYRTWCSRRSSR